MESAVEAAAGAGVATVVVDGRRSARPRATLARVPSDSAAATTCVRRTLPAGSSAEPVRRHVRARHGGAAAESVLDSLIGRARPRRRLGGGHRPLAGRRRPGRRHHRGRPLRRHRLARALGRGCRHAAAVEEAQRLAAEATAPPNWAGPSSPTGASRSRGTRRARRGRAGARPPRLGPARPVRPTPPGPPTNSAGAG